MKRNDFKPTGYFTVTNSLSAEVQINDTGEAVRYRLTAISKPSRWQQIKYDKAGQAYFTMYRRRIYLDEVMKLN